MINRLLASIVLLVASSGAYAYTSPWVDKAERDGVVYLLDAFPFELERYDLQAGVWLPTIALESSPRSLALVPGGFVIAFGNKVSRFNSDGTGEQILANAWVDPTDIAADGGFLFVFKGEQIQSIRLSDGAQVDVYTSFAGYYTPTQVALAEGADAFFGWGHFDILRINYDSSTGDIDNQYVRSYYDVDYIAAHRLFASPSAQNIIDRSGAVLEGQDLTYRGATGGYVRDADFDVAGAVLVRDTDVVLLDNNLRELGVVQPSFEAHSGARHGNTVAVFGGTDGRSVATYPVSAFAPPAGVAASSPHLPYAPTKVEMSDTGRIYLFDLAASTVHRFNVDAWEYESSIGLPALTDFVSLDRSGDRVYVGQQTGRLSVVPSGSTHDNFLAYSAQGAISMGAMDGQVLLADLTGAWESHRVFNGTTGVQTDWVDWNYGAEAFTWNRAARRMYFFRDGSSPNDLHFEQVSAAGEIVAEGETSLHGGVDTVYPIRVPDNGAYVLLGSGQIFDGINLELLGSLNETMSDAAWISTALYTLRPAQVAGRSEITRWASNFTPATRGVIPGTPVALFTRNGQVIAVTRVDDQVRLFRYSSAVSGLNVSATLAASRAEADAGDAVVWTGHVLNEGTQTSNATVTFGFASLPTGLSVLCELDGVSTPCAADTPFAVVMPSGSVLEVQAFGSMPDPAQSLVASLQVTVADDRADDNSASSTVEPNVRLFVDGFENP